MEGWGTCTWAGGEHASGGVGDMHVDWWGARKRMDGENACGLVGSMQVEGLATLDSEGRGRGAGSSPFPRMVKVTFNRYEETNAR